MGMRVLIACEFSGVVREAFRSRGHDAWSCDILPALDNSPYHYQCDVLDILDDEWDLMIAHPPCTYFTNSGVSWLHKDPERWSKLDEAAVFFNALLDADIPKICIENPVPHKYALERIGGRKYTQLIHPYQFGHLEQKATCLWLKNLPPLKHTSDLRVQTKSLPIQQKQRILWMGDNKDGKRSITFNGFADAMASQWSIDWV